MDVGKSYKLFTLYWSRHSYFDLCVPRKLLCLGGETKLQGYLELDHFGTTYKNVNASYNKKWHLLIYVSNGRRSLLLNKFHKSIMIHIHMNSCNSVKLSINLLGKHNVFSWYPIHKWYRLTYMIYLIPLDFIGWYSNFLWTSYWWYSNFLLNWGF